MEAFMKRFLLIGLLAMLLCACGNAATPTPPASNTPAPLPQATSEHETTVWPIDGWQTASPESQGMNGDLLDDMRSLIETRDYLIDSVTVVRNGYVVLDTIFPTFTPNTRHIIHSCTKSIVSTLIGIAIDQGLIDSVSQPLISFFPERTIDNLDETKASATLGHLLSMSSGLDCQDSYLYNWRGLRAMHATADWTQYVLDLPMAHEPGTHFEYCNGGSFLLSAILQEASGTSTLEFAEEHLFGPLGIEDVAWRMDPQGVYVGWGDMELRPHDMAKIGYLFLNHGLWDGERIVPADWVETATSEHIAAGTLSDGYGYQWWVDANDYYMALGYGGQFIFVLPELEMVVVFTSSLYDANFEVPEQLLNEYIIPAVTS
jgi:CubicO group peptidase (beta-lactamase class C family)